MSTRITISNVEGAFKRLHRAMEWPDLKPYADVGKPNVGAFYLSETGYGFQIEKIHNEGGGVMTPFSGWSSKREAFETMVAMAQAVEEYKRTYGEG